MSSAVAKIERAGVSMLGPCWWAGALTLAERHALPGEPAGPVDAESAARAERGLARWREAGRTYGLDQLAEWLGAPGVDEPRLRDLLAEDPVGLAGRAEKPDWARRAEAIVAGLPAEPSLLGPPSDDDVAGRAGLTAIVAPFIADATGRLATAVREQRLARLVDLESVRADLASGLARVLVALAGRTLMVELNALRVTGRLTGDTARHRYWEFVRHVRRADGLVTLITEYPVLARLLVETSDVAARSWIRLVCLLADDRAEIVERLLGGTDPGPVLSLTATATGADYACAPAVLRFAGRAGVVYRPGPLAGYARFGELAGWLNQRVSELELRAPAVLDRGGYGWVEWVEPRPATDHARRDRLSYRSGALLALLYALDGADFQEGDVVAAGEHPVPVDLTRLFQPGRPAPGSAGADPAREALAASVYRIGPLVPSNGNGDVDPASPAITWVDPGTDRMRVGPEPDLGPRHPAVVANAALLAGFHAAYEAIVTGRDELVGPGGLLWRFADAGIRVSGGAERARWALTGSTHPDVMGAGLDRERVLGLMWTASPAGPLQPRLTRDELDRLRAGVAPVFTGRAGSRDVWIGDGAIVRHDALPRPGLARAADKIRAMGARDLAAQEWIIRAGLAEHATVAASPAGSTAAGTSVEVDPRRCLAAARRLADRIAETAYREAGRVAWLGLTSVDERCWLVRPLGVGLSDGYPGVALFLAKLAELTGEERYAALARQALAHVPAMLERDQPEGGGPVGCGPFHGISGLGYALTHVAASLRDRAFLDGLMSPIEAWTMATLADQPRVLDGLAGCLAAMLAIDAGIGSLPARRIAQTCVDRLLKYATFLGEGGDAPVGFARGGSGVGWALLRYASATGDSRSGDAGLVVFRHERGLAGYLSTGVGWCDGAAGIGLARAAGLYTGDMWVAADLERAAQAVVSAGPLADHSLCHGELGCLELLAVAEAHGDVGLAGVRRRRAARLLDELEQVGPRCGTPDGVVTPELITGLAGIGYGLLRLGFPERVPSVLLLEPPMEGVR